MSIIIIPARYNSSRLPGKPLININGKPLIQWVYQQALLANPDRIIIATDDQRILQLAESFGAECCLTASSHTTGTDRIVEVVSQLALPDNRVIINWQGDAPLISVKLVNQAVQWLQQNPSADMMTFKHPISDPAELVDPHVVKVVTDSDGYALLFSRSAIPYLNNPNKETIANKYKFFKHIGLYAYRVKFLKQFAQLPVCRLEQLEQLEQLRALWHGHSIYVAETDQQIGRDVNTQQDVVAVAELLD